MNSKDNRKILYLGLDPANYPQAVFHYPIIRIIPKAIPHVLQIQAKTWTHVILTSKTAASLFFSFFKEVSAEFIAVGKMTEKEIDKWGKKAAFVAQEETQEGVIALLAPLDLKSAHLFYPHSSRSRPLIVNYLKEKYIRFTEHILYVTVVNRKEPLPDLSQFEEIVFTSSSTVEAFFEIFHSLPTDKKLTCQGPITQKTLEKFLALSYSQQKTNIGLKYGKKNYTPRSPL